MNKTELIHHNQNIKIVDYKQIKVMQTNVLIPNVTHQSILIRKLEYTKDKSLLRGNNHLTAITNLSPANLLCKTHHKIKQTRKE